MLVRPLPMGKEESGSGSATAIMESMFVYVSLFLQYGHKAVQQLAEAHPPE